MMNEKQLKERVNNLKRELAICEEILETKSDGSMGRPKGSLKYSEEQIKFLKENKNIPMNELIILYNKQFGTNLTKENRNLYNFMCRQGILEWNKDWKRER